MRTRNSREAEGDVSSTGMLTAIAACTRQALTEGRSAGHGPKHLPSINSFSTYREVGTGVIHMLWMRKWGCREVKPLAQGRPGRKWRSRGFRGANRRMTQEMNN